MNEKRIICKECGKKLVKIHWSHLRNGCTGNLKNTKEYLEKYPDSEVYCGRSTGITLEKKIRKYGEIEGKKKWDDYCKFQSEKNTFKYKKEKYGWTEEQFNNYNNKRASTESNFISRYGEEEGKKKWEKYCITQSYVGCKKEYFIEKYGEIDGIKKYNELNRKKAHTRSYYIEKYGTILGIINYEDYLYKLSQRKIKSVSKISQKCFKEIEINIENKENIYFYDKNYEYVIYLSGLETSVFLDFFDIKLNKAIEFYGDYWHANPIIYKNDEIIKYPNSVEMKSSDIHEKDKKRLFLLKQEYNIDTMVIWETDYKNNKDVVIKKCLEFLKC